eukprot:14019116-Alexandrium_andersonii.AAC.1
MVLGSASRLWPPSASRVLSTHFHRLRESWPKPLAVLRPMRSAPTGTPLAFSTSAMAVMYS